MDKSEKLRLIKKHVNKDPEVVAGMVGLSRRTVMKYMKMYGRDFMLKITKRQLNYIHRNQHKRPSDIARSLGISKGTVIRHLKAAGVEVSSGLKSEQVRVIGEMINDEPRVVAERLSINTQTVYAYMKLIGREFQYGRSEFDRYVDLLRKMQNHPGIIESIETDMEFNLPKKQVLRNAINELGITWREADHVYECVIPKRQRSRCQRALVKRKLSKL